VSERPQFGRLEAEVVTSLEGGERAPGSAGWRWPMGGQFLN